jgi:hypothetical protein
MSQTEQSRLAEYQAAQECYLHYDNFPWQVGALLMAGVFVFWGLLIDRAPQPQILGVASLLVSLLMSVWVLYACHNRQIYLCKLDRIRELEQLLEMEQHRRFKPEESAKRKYRTFGPKGHHLDVVIYLFASMGGPILGCVQKGPSLWFLLPVPAIAFVTTWVWFNGWQIDSWLKDKDTSVRSFLLELMARLGFGKRK